MSEYRGPALCPALSSFHSSYKTLNYSASFTEEETEVHKVMCPGKEVRIQNLSPADSKHPELITAEPVVFYAQPGAWFACLHWRARNAAVSFLGK